MTTTRVPVAIDYLVTLFANASTLGKASPAVSVYDGPQVIADPGQLALWVGVDDIDPGAAPNAATSAQRWAALGRMARDEELSIPCVIQTWSGSDDVRTLRLQAAAIMAAAEDLVRGDASLGGAVAAPGNAQVASAQWQQGPTTRGMAVRVTFEITAQARIGG